MALLALLALAACKQQDPELVASNCDQEGSCAEEEEQALARIEEVDILIVIDNSGSIAGESEALKAQLPRMLNAIVTGSDEDMSFPAASSVHVAVVTSDMGVGVDGIEKCQGSGDDGRFLQPGVVGVTCDVDYPGYLAYEGQPAAIATVDTVSCVPLTGTDGCGFEQPLEAGLKALWPASNDTVAFLTGTGHGEGTNAGFLRPDSLLVVVVVTDEDDCSARDPQLFSFDPRPGLATQNLNLRCVENPQDLYAPERYIENFKALRPDNDNVIFATVSGTPADLLTEEARAAFDFTVPEQVAAFYDTVLADPRMQEVTVENDPEDPTTWHLTPSCGAVSATSDPTPDAYPPRRLVEVAKAFGTSGVLASICDPNFGATAGVIIRAIAQRLIDAAEGPPDAG